MSETTEQVSKKNCNEFKVNATIDNESITGTACCYARNITVCRSTLEPKSTHLCWYEDGNSKEFCIYPLESEAQGRRRQRVSILFHRFNVAGIIVSAFSGLFLLISIARIFRPELMRCCPRFMLAAIMNLNAMLTRNYDGPHSSQSSGDHSYTGQPSYYTTAALRRRISTLIERTKLSEEEVRALHAEGWTCCICLEQQTEGDSSLSVSRLQCKHATHSTCLQSWLEKGRAVCCLCGAGVFPDDMKEGVSTSSFTSGNDGGPSGSLRVERTEGSPSSPATSISIEQSQPRPTAPLQSGGHREEV